MEHLPVQPQNAGYEGTEIVDAPQERPEDGACADLAHDYGTSGSATVIFMPSKAGTTWTGSRPRSAS